MGEWAEWGAEREEQIRAEELARVFYKYFGKVGGRRMLVDADKLKDRIEEMIEWAEEMHKMPSVEAGYYYQGVIKALEWTKQTVELMRWERGTSKRSEEGVEVLFNV